MKGTEKKRVNVQKSLESANLAICSIICLQHWQKNLMSYIHHTEMEKYEKMNTIRTSLYGFTEKRTTNGE
jgi:hypothetical protein